MAENTVAARYRLAGSACVRAFQIPANREREEERSGCSHRHEMLLLFFPQPLRPPDPILRATGRFGPVAQSASLSVTQIAHYPPMAGNRLVNITVGIRFYNRLLPKFAVPRREQRCKVRGDGRKSLARATETTEEAKSPRFRFDGQGARSPF